MTTTMAYANTGGQAVAVVVLNTDKLTGTESAAAGLFLEFGLDPSVVAATHADFDGLGSFDIVAASEEGALSADTINELIQNGKRVWLLYGAGIPVGGEWNSGNAGPWWELNIEANEIFFDGFASNLAFRVQYLGHAFYISSGYPPGWTSVGTNQNAGQKTILYREHISGGKALICTYDPTRTLAVAKNIYDFIYEWMEGEPAHQGKTVPENQAAFVISRYIDNDTAPDLTDEESALHDKLLGYGLDVTFIRSSRLKHSDLTGAAMVVAGDYPSLDRHTINDLLNDGKCVLLSGPAGASLGGEWLSGNAGPWWELKIEANEIFFDGFASNLAFRVQYLGHAFYISSGYPPGWTSVGTNQNAGQKTILYREHISGGKALIYTYNPTRTLAVAENIYDLIYEWMTGEPAHPGETVLENQVAFIISRYTDNSTAPDLTNAENALYGKLVAYGFEVTFIRSSRLKQSDLTGAIMVVASEYPSLDRHAIHELLSNAKPVLLLGSAGAPLGGEWLSGNTYAYWDLKVEASEKFFEGYATDDSYAVQNLGSAFYIGSGYPAGWASIGTNRTAGQKTALYHEHIGGGRGAVFTYAPANFTDEGALVLEAITNWLVPGTPCPPGVPEYDTATGVLKLPAVCIDGVYYGGERAFVVLDFRGEKSISLSHVIYFLQVLSGQREITP